MTRRDFLKVLGMSTLVSVGVRLLPVSWSFDGSKVSIRGPLHSAVKVRWRGEGDIQVVHGVFSTQVILPNGGLVDGELSLAIREMGLVRYRLTRFRFGE